MSEVKAFIEGCSLSAQSPLCTDQIRVNLLRALNILTFILKGAVIVKKVLESCYS